MKTLWMAVLICAAACGAPVRSGSDAGSDDDAGSSDAGPPAWGLDARPVNTTCGAFARPGRGSGIALQQVFPTFAFAGPMKLVQGGDRFYVLERAGRVRTFPVDATRPDQVTTFVTVPASIVGEGGLLGFALHPRWPEVPQAFVSYTPTRGGGQLQSVIARVTSSDGGLTGGAPQPILTLEQPFTNHNGGNIDFGADGYLYMGFGDGGSGNDPLRAGQDLKTWLGKILRLDIDAPGLTGYGIPTTNPFFGRADVKPEIYAYGLRNPWRWSFDRATHDLWVGDVGQGTWEEIDRVQIGGNYGWSVCEGFHKLGSTTALCETPGLLDPVVVHGRAEATSITGGYVYRGTAVPELIGTYVYGDFTFGTIWALEYDATGAPKPRVLANVDPGTLVSFSEDAAGELYVVQISGKISRIVADGSASTGGPPSKLNETGCMDPSDPQKFGPGVVPYDLLAPLWSDGAEKERGFALPEGATIRVGQDGDFDFPNGSVLLKSFRVGGVLVETRLFVRHDDGAWGGYTYEWNDAQTEASLLPAGKVRALGGARSWTYPSREQCLGCHSAAAGFSLGLEVAQLNRDLQYAATGRTANQLATYDHAGLLADPLDPPETLPKLERPSGQGDLALRARSYLHSNCAGCHRPRGPARGDLDLRFTTALADTHACDAAPKFGDLGLDTARILAPGAPARSVLLARLKALGADRMPPVGVTIADPEGTALIEEWIASLAACP